MSLNVAVDTDQRLYNYIVDLTPEKLHIDAHLLKMLTQSGEGPLVTFVALLRIVVLDVFVILLVDTVVGQMSKLIGLDVRSIVLF